MEKMFSVFILDKNENSCEILKLYIEELGFDADIKTYNDFKKALDEIKNSEKKAIVFADIEEKEADEDRIIEAIKLFTPQIVITSSQYSTNTIVKAMRLGAKEFLPKPIIKDDLKHILDLMKNPEADTNEINSKIITIYSNKGGIGKTTVATNLAVELAKTTRDKVALIDLNLQLGDVSTFLNINPAFDVGYVINNLISKKEEALTNAFERYEGTSLYVLSDPAYIEQAEGITPYQIEELLKALKKLFSYIVIDMSSNIDENSLKILDKSDMILFTTIVNIPAIRNAQRCLNLFRSRRYPADKVKVLINRYMENDEITIEDIEITLAEKIYWKVPNNYFSIMEAINKGVSAGEINANSNIANSFRELAIKISDDIVEKTISKYRY